MSMENIITKMYASEVFEHQQVYSLTTIYVCLMPVEISSVVCAILTVGARQHLGYFSHWFSRYTEQADIVGCFYRYILRDVPFFMVGFFSNTCRNNGNADCSVSNTIFINKIKQRGDYFKMDLERIKQTEKQQQNSTLS